jgi:hypothetical protein
MRETGEFVGDKFSAHLIYTVDLESGVFEIENVDEVGWEFLDSIEVGDQITLLINKAELSLVVTEFNANGSLVQCHAIAA